MNVIPLPRDWYGAVDKNWLLDKARDWPESDLLILAFEGDNEDVAAGSTMNEVAKILLLVERFKFKLLNGGYAIRQVPEPPPPQGAA